MKKLELIICENAATEYQAILAQEEYADVLLTTYPCQCFSHAKGNVLAEILEATEARMNDGVIICSRACDILNTDTKGLKAYKTVVANYCFQNLANEQLIEYIVGNGGYIISAGWLRNWEERFVQSGFTQETASRFYQDFCKELVFLDSEINSDVTGKLQDLSIYLNLPYKIIRVDMETTRTMIRNIILEWRLQRKNTEFNEELAELKRQNAEYSAFVHILQQISVTTQKREIVTKIIEIFTAVFGARNCVFAEKENSLLVFGDSIAEFALQVRQKCLLSEPDNRFFVKVSYNAELLGILKAEGFLFPQYIRKYAEFAVSLADVCAVVMQNARQYELLERRKDELKYLSFHDGLTQLYNRAYFNEAIREFGKEELWTVFVCDLDKMKEINDLYGHNAGDEAIRLAADLLRTCFRETDVLVRMGGDEFAVLVKGCDDEMARKLKDRLRAAVVFQNEKQLHPWRFGISIGYAVSQNAGADVEQLIHSADQAMYKDKHDKFGRL